MSIALIQKYITAYNQFDIEQMIQLIHPDIVFTNISNGATTAQAVGIDAFQEMALQAAGMFISRAQTIQSTSQSAELILVNIHYQAVLANGLKAGEKLSLQGKSEFEFKDNKIFRLTDIS
ncbi:nuclear transport factor 2 family protein [Iodobacter sp.]|uniref:nuclear transport factor 2 family protein n=1 Tax=Iodobacter sp. TaxID=1915058 RepID=UPI0025EAD589|nr:nuclear transport factor 2 family protein [Iodobacter sp.]